MKRIFSDALCIAFAAGLLVWGSEFANAAKCQAATSSPCYGAKTKADCNAIAGCKVYNDADGKSYCVKDERCDYPPYKGGYPLN